ncbi:MAG TPA: AmmeMemoRadiSam system protein B, partial [Usitatibacter sp.]|nr:AmmeMemoRadiSam system protein B [Usitatibacter sp.]
MPATRPAAVAGSFYPGDPSALAAEVASYLAAATPRDEGSPPPKAIIAPHAGYMYSGPIAGAAYARIAPLAGTVERVVLAGP